ncbi:zinc protease [Enterococcus faecium]|jgi:predicted Zn-dependent peptidase|uniref:Peptidase M16 n=14 Tax=Enterococcus TaxID=1350 RepID=A0A1S8J445_ENTFC|nr:M16C subfamily protease [Enterococcus faecium DO]APV55431.1 peptidase M16 [Enterococcus faecium]EEV42798.1 peptidase [Enterococcus faecium 1,230,933]EEV45524.1 peptidase [Enterococcus faecium 1,231,502]EEV49049.1 peptidase [Enterococcus faecium 1,231,501]EEV54639.1 peptidase [Enterococcus faecium 1,231,410]EEV57114.1 peptidase [Enterococcus faecium 1,231,408]EFR67115.1 peptidase M16 inactive domain protein [Enterococcus faecium TX0133a01]EFR70546.1 peptidase M16 inactive domain protein [
MQMNKTEYEQINETLYHEVLPNGLTVYLLPKNDYHKTYGLFSTNYGSIDNEFIPYGEKEKVKVPDGIAHFLEHKLFEKEDGDVFQLFGKQGASANAFTSFTKTSYLFSTTDQVEKNLTTLIDFVQAPYFTEETVNKEKGIIGQEIQMYEDDPNWRMFFGILNNLYPTHPLHIDIAGTVESIDKITAQDLYTCYRTFYQPSNMVLFVVGKMEPEKLMKLIRENQEAKNFPPKQEIVRYFPENTKEIIKQSALEAAITRDKFVLGIKGLDTLPQEGTELLRYKTAINLLFQMILGNTSRNYLAMYNQGIIDDSFGFEFSLDREFHFADFSGDTDEPEKAAEKVKEIILGFADDPEVSETNLDLLKKKMLGQYFQSLNSIEYIANQFTQSLFGDRTLFDLPEIIDSIQMKDVLAAGEAFISEEAFSEFYMRPK